MKKLLSAVAFSFILVSSPSWAKIVDFEDLNSWGSFESLGINNNYQGYVWGYGYVGGVASRTFDATLSSSQEGWSVGTTNSLPSWLGAISGASYAWNFDGVQSLWIDFQGIVNISSIGLARSSDFDWGDVEAKKLQLFGYDSNDNLLGSSGWIDVDGDLRTVATNINSIRFLEIRAEHQYQWFSVDNIVVNPASPGSAIPEPNSIFLAGLGLGALVLCRRKRRA